MICFVTTTTATTPTPPPQNSKYASGYVTGDVLPITRKMDRLTKNASSAEDKIAPYAI
jgi:hypothetical protein